MTEPHTGLPRLSCTDQPPSLRLQGHINTPLNDTGRAQAQMVAKRLLDDEGVRFDMAFSSDSDRASDVSSFKPRISA